MSEKKRKIGAEHTPAFLVCDDAFKDLQNPVWEWLRSEGYTFGGYHGSYGCPWAHIEITRKLYAYGMPGVGLAPEVGNHAITLEEFKMIHNIYKKYEGKELFVFRKERFDYER